MSSGNIVNIRRVISTNLELHYGFGKVKAPGTTIKAEVTITTIKKIISLAISMAKSDLPIISEKTEVFEHRQISL